MTSRTITPAVAHEVSARGRVFEINLARIAEGGPLAITDRLSQLDREWTSGRLTKAVASVLVLGGLPIALFANPWFGVIPAAGGLLLAQYIFTRQNLFGGPFRKLGYRTGAEIDEERFALKALRGDFKHLPTVLDIEDRDAIARLEGEGGMVYEPDESKVDPNEAAKQVAHATHQ